MSRSSRRPATPDGVTPVEGDHGERFGAEVRSLLAELSPPAEVRRVMETDEGHDPQAWSRLAEHGLLGVHLPSRLGGRGLGQLELALVLEAAGEVLLVGPYLSTVVTAAALAAASDDDDVDELLAAVVAGRAVLAFAVAEDSASWDAGSVSTAASPAPGGGWRLEGGKVHVLDGHLADVLVVAARDPAGEPGLYVIAADAPGLSRSVPRTVDLTRRQAALRLQEVPARRLPGRAGAAKGVELLLDLAAVALAAESVGGAQRCLDLSVGHARRRHQFGRPIGSFGAVQQTCAEMLVDLELARAATYRAAEAADQGDQVELALLAPVARISAADAYRRAAASAVQVHGGLGFTWDCDVQLYFKRARSSALLLGDARHHRERLAAQLGWDGAH